jgi:hypothetical protein
MKKVVHRLRFKLIDTGIKNIDRSQKLNSFFEPIEDIDTETMLKLPLAGAVIEVKGTEYRIERITFSFDVEDDFVYYLSILHLSHIMKKATKWLDDGEIVEPLEFRPYLPMKKFNKDNMLDDDYPF